jgi:hypothetical protein
VASNIIYPKYKFDERLKIDLEVNEPDSNLFIEVGYNRTPESNDRHYRRYYTSELENNDEVMPGYPFIRETIFRIEESGGMFGGGNPADNKAIKAGVFKGLVEVYNDERKAERTRLLKEGYSEL